MSSSHRSVLSVADPLISVVVPGDDFNSSDVCKKEIVSSHKENNFHVLLASQTEGGGPARLVLRQSKYQYLVFLPRPDIL